MILEGGGIRVFITAAGRGASRLPSGSISPGVCHEKSAAVRLNDRIHSSYSRKLVWVDTVPLLCREQPGLVAGVALKYRIERCSKALLGAAGALEQ